MSEKPSRRRIVDNVLWGVRWGLYGGMFFAALAAVPALLRSLLAPEMTDPRIPSFAVLIGIYLFGGVAAGVIVGLVRPLMRWWVARRLAGIAAAVPISFAMQGAIDGMHTVDREVESVLWFAVIWGFAVSFAAEDDPLAPLRGLMRPR